MNLLLVLCATAGDGHLGGEDWPALAAAATAWQCSGLSYWVVVCLARYCGQVHLRYLEMGACPFRLYGE